MAGYGFAEIRPMALLPQVDDITVTVHFIDQWRSLQLDDDAGWPASPALSSPVIRITSPSVATAVRRERK